MNVKGDSVPNRAEPESLRLNGSNALCSREVDQLLSDFESDWQPLVRYLKQFAQDRHLERNVEVLTELVRVDIDLRYSSLKTVTLESYFELFPSLLSNRDSVAAIAFEDFRGRRARGLSLNPERWRMLPSLQQASWYAELKSTESSSIETSSEGRARSSLDDSNHSQANTSVESSTPSIGKRFGDFELLYLLGRGTFSEVFLAKQQSLDGRYVAVKIVKRPLNEPANLARLQHTGIVPLYSLHRVGVYTVLCMPYAGPVTLLDWLTSSPVAGRDGQSFIDTLESLQLATTSIRSPQDSAEAFDGELLEKLAPTHMKGASAWTELKGLGNYEFPVWLAHRLAAALSHAHQRGIVHGDLKPANILICNDGEPALIDFNLSQSLDAVECEQMGGTLPYMAPEQLQALLSRRATLSPASDVFALGVILYELVEGKFPYEFPRSTSELDLEAAIKSQRLSCLTWQACRSNGLRGILTKCLSIKLEDRYRDAGELLEDLECERAHLPLRHAVESRANRAIKLTRRYPRLFSSGILAVIAAVAIIGVASIAVAGWQSSKRLAAIQTTREIETLAIASVQQQLNARSTNDTPTDVGPNSTALEQLNQMLQPAANRSKIGEAEFMRWLPPVNRNASIDQIYETYLVNACLLHERYRGEDHTEAEYASLRKQIDVCLQQCLECRSDAESERLTTILREGQLSTAGRTQKARAVGLDPVESLVFARLTLTEPAVSVSTLFANPLDAGSPFLGLYWLTAGEAQAKQRDFENARLSLSRAIALAPDLAIGYQLRAEAAASMGDTAAAIVDYTKAIEIVPDSPELLADRARIYELAAEIELAIADVSQALEFQPGSNRLLVFRSRLYAKARKTRQAQDDYRQALESEPTSEADWNSRGLAKSRTDPQAGLDDLNEALSRYPRSITTLQNKAYVESELLHQSTVAVESLTKLLEISPHFEQAIGGRCVLLARLGRTEDALSDIDELLLNPESSLMPSTVYQIGCAYSLISEDDEQHKSKALRYLAKALQRNYGMELMDVDPDLQNLAGDDRFEKLLGLASLLRPDSL